jgi:hypothetical protein
VSELGLLGVLKLVTDEFDRLGVPYRVVGSVASSHLGVNRATFDVDVVAALEVRHVAALLEVTRGVFYVDEQLVQDAIRDRSSFNLVHLETFLKVDVFVQKGREYDRVALERGIGESPAFMTAEDVLLGKLEWFRAGDEVSDRQWNDVLGIVRAQGNALDLEYARRWANEIHVLDLLERALKEGQS